MVDVDVRFNVGEDQPVNANFDVQPDATFTADIVVETSTKHHDELDHREYPDQHPISAITGLEDSLEQLNDDIIAESERAVAVEENLQYQIDNIDVTDDTYIYEQGIASDTWVINHNLNKFPSITLVDSAGTQFEAKREYNDMNTVTVYLNGASTGKAYLN